MRLVCPCCGGIFSAESSSCDAHARQALRLITEIPAPANKPALNYIAMFRSPDPDGLGPGDGAHDRASAPAIALEITWVSHVRGV